MKRFCQTLMLCLIGLMAIPRATAQNLKGNPTDTQVVAIETVLTQVQAALIRVQKQLTNKKLPLLKSVTLTLQTTVTKEVGAQLKLWVITIGGKIERDRAQEIVIQLTPPSPQNATKVGTEDLGAALESAIVSAAQGVNAAGTPQLPLQFSGLSASIGFTVKKEGIAGANVSLTPITADFSGDLSKTAVQNIKVVFGEVKS
ncbi:MAG: hypothetical protein LAN64_05125 [Acidobacteriia bacterium]|nr:hypothetical protein [Terriglobia bacterium]